MTILMSFRKNASTNIVTSKSFHYNFDVAGENNNLWLNNGLHIGGDNVNEGTGQQLAAGDLNLPSQQQIKSCECSGNTGSATCCCTGRYVQCCAATAHGQTNDESLESLQTAVVAATGDGSAASAGIISSGVSSCTSVGETPAPTPKVE